MLDDDDFRPRLGRKRGKEGKKAAKFASRIVVAAGLNAASRSRGKRRFDGSRIGRGASIGRLLASRDRLAGFRARRAVVKTRLVRLGGNGMGAARAHLRYIQRDGVTREGTPGELYAAGTDRADGNAFLERCDGDRHQFRFIVSAEDADQYRDLKLFVRRLMQQVEEDLGTRLDWVAVDHFNTGHPHTHIALRGVDDRGENLVIAREYISHGLRERTAELVTLDLGPRTDREIENCLRKDVDQERLTAIDRRLLSQMDEDRVVAPWSNDPLFHTLEAGRLQTLKRMGLAEDLGGANWRLAEGLESTLRGLGERGDIIRLMQREMTRARLDRDQRIHSAEAGPLIGRVIMRGLADELRDRHFLLVDGLDGQGHYVDIGAAGAVEPLPEGAVVRVVPRAAEVRAADRSVADVATANEGRYSVALQLRHDRSATQEFAEAHVRRLEAMRRSGMDVTREADGSWRISADHSGEAERYERRLFRDRPVSVEILSSRPLDELSRYDGATWLDRELEATSAPARDAGFGRELRQAIDARRQWLIEQELADASDGFQMRAGAIALLQRRELLRVASEIADSSGKTFVEAKGGDALEGTLTRRVDLASARFGVLERSHEFTLVPWRPELQRMIGKSASGIVQERGVSWRVGRGRAGPEIS